MKNKPKKEQKAPFAPSGYLITWFWLLIIAIVFSQALRHSISYVFLIIVILLPPLDLAYTVIASFCVKAGVVCKDNVIHKKQSANYVITVKNSFILPLPFTSVTLISPVDDGLITKEEIISVPLLPNQSRVCVINTVYKYKGRYECGVKNIYVSGLLRFFKIKLRSADTAQVVVMPERLDSGTPENPDYDGTETSLLNVKSGISDVSQIKIYTPGEPSKNIHWKLSVKSEDILTKHFGISADKAVCVAADFGCRYPLDPEKTDADLNEYCDDCVCCICYSLMSDMTDCSTIACIAYFDKDKHGTEPVREECSTEAELKAFFEEFVAVKPHFPDIPSPEEALFKKAFGGKQSAVIYVCSRLTYEAAEALIRSKTAECEPYVMLCAPYGKLKEPVGYEEEHDAVKNRLASAGIKVISVSEEILNEE